MCIFMTLDCYTIISVNVCFAVLCWLWFQLGKFTGIKAATILGGDRSVFKLDLLLLIAVMSMVVLLIATDVVGDNYDYLTTSM